MTRDSGRLPLFTIMVRFSPATPQKVEDGITASNPASADANPVSIISQHPQKTCQLRRLTLGTPVANDKSFKPKFGFQKAIECFAIRTSIRVVHSIVGTHNTAGTCVHCFRKRPEIEFVDGLVINIGRNSSHIRRRASVRLLFVPNVVLYRSNHTRALHSLDSLCYKGPTEIRYSMVSIESSVRRESQGLRSLLIPSQFLPPSATRPRGPTTGPRATLTPFVLNSPPI